ncbi:MAG: (Fe-S)-binding protein [Desulfarculus sp.]|nr:MAG: (Fe-S)-binding protein [Desulfarculus sp.]
MPATPFLEVSQAIALMGGETLYQCMQCGLCSALCPWPAVDSPFRTRQLIKMGQLGLEGFESDDILYACTTCKLCVVNCPREVAIIDVVRAMRAMIAESGAAPQSLRSIMGSIHSKGNPWSEDRDKREAWTQGLTVPRFDGSQEYFLSVCCTSAFDPRSQDIAKALVKVLNAAGVSYGIIGNEESCCGEALRKMGDEEQFGNLAQKNIKLFQDKGVKKIITTSPHCYMTYTQEYPALGGEFEVVHYTQLLKQLLDEGKIKLGGFSKKVIYHDPCYLGRHSEVFEEPRALLAATGAEVLEFGRNQRLALCCGGGGGRLWMETEPEQRFSTHKVREAVAKGAEVLATCCPYCINMFTDSAKTENVDEKLAVKDLAEIMAESLA